MNRDVILTETSLEEQFRQIPDQMAFKIGDVADLLQVKPYVLRYWEQEFKALNPKKAVNNQRIYSRRDVETVILIKKFLYVDQFSIPGARKALKEYREGQNPNLALSSSLNPSPTAGVNVESAKETLMELNTAAAAADLLPEKYVKIEESINRLVSKIRSVKGKLEHRFHQLGL